MRFEINKEEFLKALQVSTKSLLTKTNLPILSNVFINSSKGGIEVLSTNLETAVKIQVSCKVSAEGALTVSGRSLYEFTSQIPEGELVFEKLGEEAVITSAGYNGRFATMDVSEFPAIPKIEAGQVVSVVGKNLIAGIKRVAFAASLDEGRPILTGVYAEFSKNKLIMVATDGYRLSFDEVEAKGASTSIKIIIPAKSLLEVSKIIEEMGQLEVEIKMTIANSLNQMVFKIGNVEFTSRLIDGEFPNWQKTIPSSFSTNVDVDKEEFLKLVRAASIFAREAGNIIKIKLEPKNGQVPASLSVFANAREVGSGNARIDAKVEGVGGEIAFNFRYLIDVLSVIDDEQVSFEMIEALNPGKIKGAQDKSAFFHIIMPVRMQG